MSLVVDILGYGTFVVDLVLVAGLLFYLSNRFSGRDMWQLGVMPRVREFLENHWLEIAFVQALVATLGSLYLSNILGWEPCRLCWFQRIMIYPMTVLLGTALFLDRDDVEDYVMPLAIIGIPISIYHYAIQRVEQFHAAGCSITAVSCSTDYTFYMGYVTIPMMALTAMVVVLVLAWRFSGE